MLVSEAVGAALAELGADTVFGVVGSGNFHVTNALIARSAARPAWLTAGRGRRAALGCSRCTRGPA
jgi:thiamine pyrophosphate-dependent acetolactate synthase large subunit-like protein